MAKNAGRKANTEAQKQAAAEKKAASDGKKKDVIYQVKTKRDSDVIKAYITFNYRVMHPGVTTRLILYGILIAAPAIIIKIMWLRILCLVLGGLLILLGLFRQYISLALTKNNDEAYKNGTVFTYEFTASDVRSLTGDKPESYGKYKDITSFYYDKDFFYIGMKSRDFFILPKSRFTIGDPDEFEEFIYSKSKKSCRWIPDNFRDQMKQRRARRAVNASSQK